LVLPNDDVFKHDAGNKNYEGTLFARLIDEPLIEEIVFF